MKTIGIFNIDDAGKLDFGKPITERNNIDRNDTSTPHVRYVPSANAAASRGVSAGIDIALWLTRQMFTPTFAQYVQRGLQHDPAPPYTADI